MLSKLTIKLLCNQKNLGYQTGSSFQGVLMEHIAPPIAEDLHQVHVNPYSQWITGGEDNIFWNITGLNSYAYENIVKPLMDLDIVSLKNKELELPLEGVHLDTMDRHGFIETYLFGDYSRKLDLFFTTPTAFRSKGRYIIMPDIRLLYQSLMNKFEATGDENIFTMDLLENLFACTTISQYNLKSTLYSIEKVKIPAFIGRIQVTINGPKELTRIANLLLRFGEYSGVGLKTAMGMGSYSIRR